MSTDKGEFTFEDAKVKLQQMRERGGVAAPPPEIPLKIERLRRHMGMAPDDPAIRDILDYYRRAALAGDRAAEREQFEKMEQYYRQRMAKLRPPTPPPAPVDQSVLGQIRAMQSQWIASGTSISAGSVYLGEATYQRMLKELTPTNPMHQEAVLMKRVLGLHVNVLKDVAEHIGIGFGGKGS